jgi:hypothetical protein
LSHTYNYECGRGLDVPSCTVPIFTMTFSARVRSNSRPTRSSSVAFLMPCATPRPLTSYSTHSSPHSRQKHTPRSTPVHLAQLWLRHLLARRPRHALPPRLRLRYDPRRYWFPALGSKPDYLMQTPRLHQNRTQAAAPREKTRPKCAKRACGSARREWS